jgi:hypothetical protein
MPTLSQLAESAQRRDRGEDSSLRNDPRDVREFEERPPPLLRLPERSERVDPRQQAIDILGDPTIVDTVLNMADQARAEFERGLTSTPLKAIAIGARALALRFGDDKDLEQYATWAMGDAIDKYIAAKYPGDPRLRGSFSETLGKGAGSMAAFGPVGAAGGTAAIALHGAAMEGVPQFEAARAAGVSRDDQEAAAFWGALVGASEIAGEPLAALRIFRRMDKASGGSMRRMLGGMAVASGREAAQEVSQQLGSNTVARIYDANRDLFDGVVEAGLVAGILGPFVHGMAVIGKGAWDAGAAKRVQESPRSNVEGRRSEESKVKGRKVEGRDFGPSTFDSFGPATHSEIRPSDSPRPIRETIVFGDRELSAEQIDALASKADDAPGGRMTRKAFADAVGVETKDVRIPRREMQAIARRAQEIRDAEGVEGPKVEGRKSKVAGVESPRSGEVESPGLGPSTFDLRPSTYSEAVGKAEAAQKELNTAARRRARYASERGYHTKAGDRVAQADETYQELLADEKAAQQKESRARSVVTRLENQSKPKGKEDFVSETPLHVLPEPVASAIQQEAAFHLDENKVRSIKSREALQRIVRDQGEDVGAEVQKQKKRLIDYMMGRKDARTIFEKQIGVPERPVDEVIDAYLSGATEEEVHAIAQRLGYETSKSQNVETSKRPDLGPSTFDLRPEVGAGLGGAAEALQQSTDIPPYVARITPTPPRGDKAKPGWYFTRKEIADEFERTRGLSPTRLLKRIWDGIVEFKHLASRSSRHLSEKEFPLEDQFFNQLRNTPGVVKDEVNRTLGAIINGLSGRAEMDMFADALILRNQLAALDRGEPLRHPFESREEVEQNLANIEKAIQDAPAVADAIEQRTKIVRELTEKSVALGLLPEAALENADDYFHQQVLMYHDSMRMATAARSPRPRKRGFQKRRVRGDYLGREYAYNKDYLEAEGAWMRDVAVEVRKAELRRQYLEPGNLAPQLKADAKTRNEAGEETDWKELIPDTHDIWQPKPGRVLYQAFSIPDRIAEGLMAGELEGLDPEVIKTVLAVGGPNRQMVLPKPVVDQLRLVERQSKQHNIVDRVIVRALDLWKQYILLNPKRWVAYNLRNATGDIDPVIGGAMKVFPEVPGAAKDLWDYYRGKIAITPEIRASRDQGVITSSMSEAEIPDVKDLPVFRRFYDNKIDPVKIPLNVLRTYFRAARNASVFRENLMRHASFLRFRKALADGGPLLHYAASIPKTVEALRKEIGVDAAAGKMARDLLGDYGNTTELGTWFSAHVWPFWRFQEVNMKRAYRMAANAIQAGEFKRVGPVALTAVLRAVLTVRLASLYALVWAWNHFRHPEQEEQLSPWQRQNPHLNLGVNDDGTSRVFNNFGSFGEFLEWFGINSLIDLIDDVESGQMSPADVAKVMGKDVLNKLVQGVRPDVKAVVETATGESLFPDVTSPRMQPRDELFANIFGLADEMKAVRGKVMDTGERLRPHYLQRMLLSVTDNRQNALNEIYSLRARFLKSKGREDVGVYPPSKIRTMKLAAVNDDYEAFLEARKVYTKEGGTRRKFHASLDHLDPIAAKLNRELEREFEHEFLDGDQRKRLKVARDYAKEIESRLALWWRRAEGVKGPKS